MLISDEYQFVFIHIYKNAGTSVAAALANHSNLMFFFRNSVLWKWSFAPVAHYLEKYVQQDLTKAMTGFPHHATMSQVLNSSTKETLANYTFIASVRHPYDHVLSLYNFIYQNPNHFLNKEVRNNSFAHFLDYFLPSYFIQQADFIDWSDKLKRKILRVENINEDFFYLCDGLGLPYKKLSKRNVTKSTNQVNLTQQDKKKIRNLYKEDFRRFSY